MARTVEASEASERGEDRRHGTSRRRILAAGALTPVLAGMGGGAAHALPAAMPAGGGPGGHALIEPVPSAKADWAAVARVLGRDGSLLRGVTYHTAFNRSDLRVFSHGVRVTPGLALGSHVAFARYADGSTMAMGDIVVTEDELQAVTDAFQRHGIAQTAIHKHLLAHHPDIWWTHIHAHGKDPVAIARGVRAGLDRTATPPPAPPPTGPIDLDTDGIDTALGIKGSGVDGIYKAAFIRAEKVVDSHLVLPPGLGATTAFVFQPVGGGRAALHGDCAVTADEVDDVIGALRRGGISLVELHNHHLRDTPRLFFIHFWAVDDAVRIARALRRTVDVTNVIAPPESPPRGPA
ncbi:DUF1259 domain-containing protein [Streptomyces clavuligerus]|uniref:Lipoprotein lpqO n=1 Tax=Streptomyces clavuligerus TaxID=1901 RepID=B5GMH2_STRCL|nr:DUF1259 domain-containing protein [Streptomyces clavuligerus]ANW22383.1 peptidase M23 [Streptomyces clavuligerus]AXU17289.1 DUF1259 domain-containing protein [Streptomyces clavuligerus]EDY47518.1 conserved hypothetical protein [Streptomyces clavuligerus]EFG04479.1 Lipoprotein lpqO [Streptomyces clavuligerus]MBY6307066.1 DUF1259 domain-containing protein [Streptomyces clavuligerus]